MARKKKFAGEINFYKAMTVLGALLAGGLVYAFFGSAPDLSDHPFHVAGVERSVPPHKRSFCLFYGI